MIIILLTDGTQKKFNLNDYDRERSLHKAWYSMHGDGKYADKSFKIVTDNNESLKIRVGDIKDCVFDESRYVQGEVNENNIQDREKPQPKSQPSPAEKVEQVMNGRRKERINKFVNLVQARGITPNYQDPMFIRICESVAKDSDVKIPYYANFYCNTRGRR